MLPVSPQTINKAQAHPVMPRLSSGRPSALTPLDVLRDGPDGVVGRGDEDEIGGIGRALKVRVRDAARIQTRQRLGRLERPAGRRNDHVSLVHQRHGKRLADIAGPYDSYSGSSCQIVEFPVWCRVPAAYGACKFSN